MNEDLAAGGWWCPECGREYRPGFTECFYCKVPLTDVAPAEPLEPDHSTIEYDLSDWDDEQRSAVSLLLRAQEVEPVWQGATLVVPRVHEVDADMAIDEVEASFDEAAPTDLDSTDPPDAEGDGIELATVASRVVAKVIDGLVGSAVFALLFSLGVHRRWPVLPAIGAVLEIVCVAAWGRTPGRVAMGTKVVDRESAAIPGLRAAIVRYAVPAIPGLLLRAAGFPTAVTVATLAWQALVYAGLFTDDLRRGLHDRAAGTITIRSR